MASRQRYSDVFIAIYTFWWPDLISDNSETEKWDNCKRSANSAVASMRAHVAFLRTGAVTCSSPQDQSSPKWWKRRIPFFFSVCLYAGQLATEECLRSSGRRLNWTEVTGQSGKHKCKDHCANPKCYNLLHMYISSNVPNLWADVSAWYELGVSISVALDYEVRHFTLADMSFPVYSTHEVRHFTLEYIRYTCWLRAMIESLHLKL